MAEREKLEALHAAGFNCAQCVAAAFCDKMGLDERTAFALSGGFGGGFRSGEICGAAAGAVMVLGTQVPHVSPHAPEEKAKITAATQDFLRRFQARYSYLTCRDLKGKGKVPCNELICGAVEILDEMLAEK